MKLTTQQVNKTIRLAALYSFGGGDYYDFFESLTFPHNPITPGQAWTDKEIETFRNLYKSDMRNEEHSLYNWTEGNHDIVPPGLRRKHYE